MTKYKIIKSTQRRHAIYVNNLVIAHITTRPFNNHSLFKLISMHRFYCRLCSYIQSMPHNDFNAVLNRAKYHYREYHAPINSIEEL